MVKDNPVSDSYRRITVTLIIGALIDYHLDPVAALSKPWPAQIYPWNLLPTCCHPNRGVSKTNCEAAFPSVEKNIQVRELYLTGEKDDLLRYSKSTYVNPECQLKLQDKLSRKV